ncbi:MAG TPA: ABC transporter ATP-binding protein [Burkholderiales bacterium]|nr:ABC transporter ATP-binding protein [Burkholderiales bacterium]
MDINRLCWPMLQLGEALRAIAFARGLAAREGETPALPAAILAEVTRDEHSRALHEWIEAAADYMGFEAEAVEASHSEIETLVRGAGPALLRLPGQKVLAVLGSRGRYVSILAPDGRLHRVGVEVISAELRRPHEEPLAAGVARLLREAGVIESRREQAQAAILDRQLGSRIIGGGWILRLSSGASFWKQLCEAGLLRELIAPIALHAAHYAVLLAAWWVLGRGALNGRMDTGWLAAWTLFLLTAVPLHIFAVRAQGRFTVGASALLKRRLLYGTLRLKTEEIRHQGIGHWLGRVIESNAIESLALNGGFQAFVAMIELVLAMWVLGAGSPGFQLVLLLAGYVGITLVVVWRYYRRRLEWTEMRMTMAGDLVERMVGHRTRLAQESSECRHEGEDQVMERYLARSLRLDRADLWQSLLPRGWLALGLCGLSLSFVSGSLTPVEMAVAIGGLLLGFRGLQHLVASLSSLLGASVAWTEIADVFKAAARPQAHSLPDFAARHRLQPAMASPVVVEAHDVTFRYRERARAVLRDCRLQIREGDRLLLEGSSGGGKSTLAALLMGLREPESGLMLAGGLDRQTIGEQGWRRRVVCAPQFHENYVMTATFAFNLLMGRKWPPSFDDLREAEEVCRALGLGDLLDRMPAGLFQMVGETGWQLSHGERSRLFMARALLQGADLTILDESFGALDPETLGECLHYAMKRVPTLMVIAHP